MECYHPLMAFYTSGGEVVWAERGDIVRTLSLPCGQCIGCRLERSRQWAVRVMHEAALHEENCFITLTYDDEHLTAGGSLEYGDFQRFLKRLRKRHPVRFFACGEYGEDFDRPHFHAALFGYSFRSDRVKWKRTGGGFYVDRSAELEVLWPFGFASVGNLTFESAAYIARYVTKKVTGDRADRHYERIDFETGEVTWREPEMVHMSLKPGIGAGWFERFSNEVYPLDRVVIRGVPMKPPRFYDVMMGRRDPGVVADVKEERVVRALARGDQSEDRLIVKEKVTEARFRYLKRELK